MRKPLIGVLAGVFVLAFAAAAFAVTNTYSVTATVSPAKAGSKSKPVPVGLNFNYQVGEAGGLRPSVLTGYSILFGGIQANGADFPKCTAAQINSAGSSSPCPSGAKVGAGNVENIAGPTTDPSNKSQQCHLDLTLYNGGKGHLTLFLAGNPPRAR